MSETVQTQQSRDGSLKLGMKRSTNTIKLNLKYIISNPKIFLIISLFYIIALMIGIIFLPVYMSGGVMLLIAVILPSLLILGAIGSNLKKSTLYKNVFTSGVKRRTFYISQLITTVIVVNIIALVYWLLVAFVGLFHIFLGGWIWEGAGRITFSPFVNWAPVLLIYITNVTALLVFAFYFLVDSVTKNSKSYNLVVSGIFIIGIIFGGSLNTSFGRPLNVWNYDWGQSGGINGIDYWKSSFVGPIYVTEDFYNSTNGLTDFYFNYNATGITPQDGLLPDFMIVPTLIFNPFYGVGEFTTSAITKGMSPEYGWHLNQPIIIVDSISTLNPISNIQPLYSSSLESVSIWSWFHLSFKDGSWMWTAVVLQPFITMFAYVGIGAVIRKVNRK